MVKKNGLDKEMIIGYAVFAMLTALSIIFIVLIYFSIDLKECSGGVLVSAFSVLTGFIWGILLIRNC